MKEKLVTILTPTYNRAYCLNNLYNSLLKQNDLDFTWLIIDDGSSDDTKDVVSKMEEENKIPIQYIYKNNGGKHTALNVGISKIKTKYVFIVDSDDVLSEDAIEKIKAADMTYGELSDICGYSFLRRYPDGKINGKLFEPDGIIDTYINVRLFGDDSFADKAEVFFTDILKKFPFPEFEGERFLGEDIVWIELSKKYKMVHLNNPIYIGDYQTDGLTKNRRKNNIKSCKGCYARSKTFLTVKLPFKVKVKNVLQLVVYGKFCGYKFKDMYKDYRNFFLIALYVPALFLYFNWKKKYVIEGK